MTERQRLTGTLTSLHDVIERVLKGMRPLAPIEISLAESPGCIAAEMKTKQALPQTNVALADGWAMQARDLAGASSYAPLPLAKLPVWVEAGEPLPPGCDSVIDEDAIERQGPIVQVVTEAIPGEGVRRIGEDVSVGQVFVAPGERLSVHDVMVLRAAGRETILVRRPQVHLIEVPAHDRATASAGFVAAMARAAGARVSVVKASGRDVVSVASLFDADAADLVILVGGSGVGRSDAAVKALASRGAVLAHGLAMRPGRTAAAGTIGSTPVLVVPGLPAHALAVWHALVQPVLDRLSGHGQRRAIVRPLARKISSTIGFAEFALLKMDDDHWMPLATGELPLGQIAAADAWAIVPADSEGYPAGSLLGAFLFRNP